MKSSIFETIARHMQSAPVDVFKMARDLGIEVKERVMQEGQSGSIEKRGDQYLITVNAAHPVTRKRFTVAHELGHFLFHDHLIGDGIFDNKMYRDDRISHVNETQANRFAASILMPDSLIQELREQGINDPARMAQKLGVSEQAMTIRLNAM